MTKYCTLSDTFLAHCFSAQIVIRRLVEICMMPVTNYGQNTKFPSIYNVMIDTSEAVGNFRRSIKNDIPVISIVYL